jgi:hypothetical protein
MWANLRNDDPILWSMTAVRSAGIEVLAYLDRATQSSSQESRRLLDKAVAAFRHLATSPIAPARLLNFLAARIKAGEATQAAR